MPKGQDVEQMFDRIAGRYDLLNRVMTMGVDRRWRRAAVRAAKPQAADVLDACCGTGDIAFSLAHAGATSVVGLDFSNNMLDVARKRAEHLDGQFIGDVPVTFVQGDVLDIKYPDASFDAATVGFGVRNVEDLDQALREFRRVLRPGGRFVILEITRPKASVARVFYNIWFDRVVPVVGGWISGDKEAYSYLPESTKRFPPPDELAARMRSAGFANVQYKLFAGGIVALHLGLCPLTSSGSSEAPVAIATGATE
jgi:demethylmenaquinone methyltransferase/2-methoxy-6-polyprenyl-1,4-benzoquinol methylase